MSQAMIDAINRWKDMINGRADWIDEKRGVLSLRTEIGICREFTDIALGEMDAKVSSPVLVLYFHDKTIGTVIILVSMVFKMAECCFRLIRL